MGSLDLRTGLLVMEAGLLKADIFLATNGAASVVRLQGGTNQFGTMTVATGTPLALGNGTNTMLLTLSGSGSFRDGLTVLSNATLSGTATIINPVTVQGGGLLSPGNSPGTLAFSTLTLATGGNISSEIASTNLYDLILATNLTVNGLVNWNLTLTGTMEAGAPALTLFEIGSYGAGLSTGWLSLGGTNNLSEGNAIYLTDTNGVALGFQVSYLGGDGNDVTLSVVPEPATGLLALLGMGALYVIRRSRPQAG